MFKFIVSSFNNLQPKIVECLQCFYFLFLAMHSKYIEIMFILIIFADGCLIKIIVLNSTVNGDYMIFLIYI